MSRPDKLRTVRLGRFTVTTYDLGTTDHRGQTAIGYSITDGHGVVAQCGTGLDGRRYGGAPVYGSPMHADDSDATTHAVITLVCHGETHDADDRPLECPWADELAELADGRWS